MIACVSNKIIGLIQPKNQNKNIPELYSIGCAAKITSYNELERWTIFNCLKWNK